MSQVRSQQRPGIWARSGPGLRPFIGVVAAAVALGGVTLLPASGGVAAATARPAQVADEGSAQPDDALELWYDEPATNWESQSLPIGNGPLGASIFGGVGSEELTLNEKTLWTGGPGASGGYNYGNWTDDLTDELAEVRAAIADQGQVSPSYVAGKLGKGKSNFGAYQVFGTLGLSGLPSVGYGDYRRSLDIADGLAGVEYTSGGVSYSREYFASYPANVIAGRLSADQTGKIGFTAAFTAPNNRSQAMTSSGGRITFSGALSNNGLRYEAQLQLVADGGTVTDNPNGTVTVAGADSVDFYLSMGTNYSGAYADGYRGADPHAAVTEAVDAARDAGYGAVRDAHLADYHELFDRVDLDLDQAMPDQPTDALLDDYRSGVASGPARRALEILFFQYGRYLLIASSRAGSNPANLQGVWNNSTSPAWSSDYHTNINLQMNYWPAEVTNLSETTEPLFDYVDNLVEPGEESAQMLGARGWHVGNETNPWGFTGLHNWATAFWFPEAAAWLARHYWEHYLYTGDEDFLVNRAYPHLKALSQFWFDFLVPDRDGTLVSSPSFSPEQGNFTAGASMSQQIIWDLFNITTQASKIVDDDDAQFAAELSETAERLDPGLRIGSWGQLQEWKADLDSQSNNHRHVSHLYGVFPGDEIQPGGDTEDYFEAAKVSLNARGDAGTGWSKAWKINFWSRLLDGERAHLLLGELLKNSTLDNLWDTHPPFQIDGNFGATSGIAEMLLQSHRGVIDVLPALPAAWANGSVSGLKARGNVTVGVDWTSGRATEIRLDAGRDGPLSVSSAAFAAPVRLMTADGEDVAFAQEGSQITFDAVAGQSYVVTALASITVSAPDSIEGDEPFEVTVDLSTAAETLPAGELKLNVPDGWSVEPAVAEVAEMAANTTETVTFEVIGEPTQSGTAGLEAVWAGDDWTLTGVTSVTTSRILPCPAAPQVGPLVAWDPTSGPTITDASIHGRDAQFSGQDAAYAAEGPTGSAAILNGGYLTAGQTKMGFAQEATFAAEIKISPTSGYRRIWDWKTASGGDGDGVLIDLTPSGTMRLIGRGQNTAIAYAPPTGTWIDLVVTIGASGRVNVYVDGNRVAGASVNGTGVNGCNGGSLRFGADQNGNQKITASVDRAAIFARALTAAEIGSWQSLALDPPPEAEVAVALTGTKIRGWYGQDVQIALDTMATTDEVVTEFRTGDGAWQEYSEPKGLPEGGYQLCYRARYADSVLDEHCRNVKVDLVAPAVVASVVDRAVTLSATDSGVGGATIEYQVDGGEWTAYDSAVSVGAGDHRLAYRASDALGNTSETQEVQILAETPQVPGVAVPARVTPSLAKKTKAGKKLKVVVRVSASGVVPTGTVKVKVAGAQVVTEQLVNGKVVLKVRIPRTAASGKRKVVITYLGSAEVSGARVIRTVKVRR